MFLVLKYVTNYTLLCCKTRADSLISHTMNILRSLRPSMLHRGSRSSEDAYRGNEKVDPKLRALITVEAHIGHKKDT